LAAHVSSPHHQALLAYRVDQLERAVETMADAAERQGAFNGRVESFMVSVRTWGRVGLLVYGTGQSLVVGVLLYGVQKLGG
jgi:uncharacterized protein YjfI (DUF2170 family)